jgi:hypothetical protein
MGAHRDTIEGRMGEHRKYTLGTPSILITRGMYDEPRKIRNFNDGKRQAIISQYLDHGEIWY